MSDDPTHPGLRARIKAHVTAQITSGAWQAGARIPSESSFADMFGASRMTVHHALRDLTTQGFLTRRSGSGTFVAQAGAYVAEYAHLDVIAEIAARGAVHSARVLRREIRGATEAEAEAFRLAPGSDLFHAVIVHSEDGAPLELEDRLIDPRVLPDCMAIDLARQTLFSRLMFVRPPREGSEQLRAIHAGAQACAVLAIGPREPCLEMTRRTWSADGVVTVARMLRAGTRWTLQGVIRARPLNA